MEKMRNERERIGQLKMRGNERKYKDGIIAGEGRNKTRRG